MVGGNRKAMYSSAKVLEDLGHNITFVSWGEEQTYTTHLGKIKVIHRNTKTSNTLYKQLGTSSKLPDLLYQFGSEVGAPEFLSLFSRGPSNSSSFDIDLTNFDLIIKEGPDLNNLTQGSQINIPKIERLHWIGTPMCINNLDAWKEFTRSEGVENIFLHRTVKKIIDRIITTIELNTVDTDNLMAVSASDKDKAIQYKPTIGNLRTVLLPVTTQKRDVSYRGERKSEIFKDKPYVIFFSTQNRSSEFAVLYIYKLSKIMPRINFVIVGKINVNKNIPTQTENFKILGFLPDPDFYNMILDATAIIFPKIQGHGLQMKLIEAFSFRKPIIITSPLFKELPGLINRENVILEDDPIMFGSAIEEVVGSDEMQRKLTYESRKYYENYLSPEVHKKNMQKYIENVVSKGT